MDSQTYNKLRKETWLMTNKQAIAYCKRHLKRLEKPLKQTKNALRQLEDNPKMIAEKPYDVDMANDDANLIFDSVGDKVFVAGVTTDFTMNFDVSHILQEAVNQHKYFANPKNFISYKDTVAVLKKHVEVCNQNLRVIANAHRYTKSINFKLLISNDTSKFDRYCGSHLQDPVNVIGRLQKSKVPFRKRAGDIYDKKRNLLNSIDYAKDSVKDDPHTKFGRDDVINHDDPYPPYFDEQEEADYQLFVKHRKP